MEFFNLLASYIILFRTISLIYAAHEGNNELIETVMGRVNSEIEKQLVDFERIEEEKIAALKMQIDRLDGKLSTLSSAILRLTNLINLHHKLLVIKSDTKYSKLLCPVGWDLSPMQMCIKGIEGYFGLSWSKAKAFCTELGGDLVSIHKNETNAWLSNKVTPYFGYWIGMNNMNEVDKPIWSNGNRRNYERFGNNASNTERCYSLLSTFQGITAIDVTINATGKWFANNCENTRWFFCEIQPINGNIF